MIISVPVDETLDGMNELLRPIRRELVGLHGQEVEIEDVRDVPSTDHRLHLLPKVFHGLPVVHLRIMEEVLLRNHEQQRWHPHMRHGLGRQLRRWAVFVDAHGQAEREELVDHLRRQEQARWVLDLRPALLLPGEAGVEEHSAGELHRVQNSQLLLLASAGSHEVHKVAAGAVADEEHAGEVGSVTEPFQRCRRVLIAVDVAAAVCDITDPQERGMAGIDGGGEAVLWREGEVNGDYARDAELGGEWGVEVVVERPRGPETQKPPPRLREVEPDVDAVARGDVVDGHAAPWLGIGRDVRGERLGSRRGQPLDTAVRVDADPARNLLDDRPVRVCLRHVWMYTTR
ncbi:hypothetical protein PVAP13_8NG162204 [Panicum virgatum]|uniref:Uncharacterized protein n=1 Tax=Panicum virgatum TaxID=38727 RepID=A0A8T0P9Y8_PANVG|nr:hypothetical protein PVAP13_8NG162204 [Panicum virgatum]